MADIFSDIFKFAGTAINQALTPDNLRDYRHASKLFVDDQYRLLPKLGFLYHVAFDINDSAARPNPTNPNALRELGLLVKSVSLPKFTIDTKKYNSYNRPDYVQTKINYDPVTISFHDDSANVIRNFWFDYFNYYYRDSDYQQELYGIEHKYQTTRPSDKWGYSPRLAANAPRYINAIRIYSLHQKHFSEYVLINPIIKSFRHGEHSAGNTEPMGHEMTIEYESVLYFYGSTTPSNVKGFAELHYDNMPSPLTPAGGGTKSILGAGGLLDTASDVIKDVKDQNYGSAIFKGLKGLKTAGSMDLKKAAVGELLGIGTGILRGNNPQNGIFVPGLAGLGGVLSTVSGGGVGGALGAGILAGISDVNIINGINSYLTAFSSQALTIPNSDRPGNQEMSDATSYLEGFAPYSGYSDFPAPDDSDQFIDGYSSSTIYSGELSLADADLLFPPSNQGSMNEYGELNNLVNNIDIGIAALQDLEVEANRLKEQQQLILDSIESINTKKQDLLAVGVTEDDNEIIELNQAIEIQLASAQMQDNKLNELSEKTTNLAAEVERQIIRKEGITGVGGI